ncbi:MAG: hypothetical protein JW951_04775, partial [Lentisphaerae bacterium]|nr:hypothetical protein [Lentisphaerota bacterium]
MKRRLPSLILRPPARGQRARLARWLHDWELYCALEQPAAGPPLRHTQPPRPPGPRPRRGQIRLMYPATPGARHRPLYLAVLEAAARDTWLAA